MFDTIFGLPVHPFVVHATVVVVPAASAAVGLAALWPRFRRWAGPLPLLLAVASLGLVPVTVQSGKSLVTRVERTALVERHRELGEGLLVWVVVLVVAAAALFWLRRWEARRAAGQAHASSRLLVAGVVLVALVATSGSMVQVIRIGHSGADAAWSELIKTARPG